MTTLEQAKKGIESWSAEAQKLVRKIEDETPSERKESVILSIYDEFNRFDDMKRMIGLKIRSKFNLSKIKIDII